jgi:hypothetical protein
MPEDVCRLYVNIMTIDIRNLNICSVWYPWGNPETNLLEIPRDKCIVIE